jgi:predicted ATPase
VTRFLGRESELSAIDQWRVSGKRLLTITGPPGVGKSRIVREHANARPGSIVCELTSCRIASDVERVLQAALGGVSRARLARTLATFDQIIVLDRFEHLVESARMLVQSWTAGSGARFVVTSREPLGLENEQVLALGPLEDADAVALYAARARRAIDPDVALAIVRRLDRMPLAIELAAARAAVLSENELSARLERGLGAIDSSAARLRTTILWSIDLLDPGERATLLQCAIFRGPFAARAAEAIVRHAHAADTIEHLVALERKSLLRSVGSDEPRVVLYDAVRETAHAELAASGGLADVAARHAGFFLEVARAAIDAPSFVNTRAVVGELADLALAHSLLVDREPAGAATIALATDLANEGQPPSEAHLQLLSSAVDCAERAANIELTIRALHARARASRLVGATRRSNGDLRAALTLARRSRARHLEADVLRLLGVVARQLARPWRARCLLESALALHESSKNLQGEATVRDDLGVVAHDLGDFAGARESYERALALERIVGDRRFEGITLGHLGVVAYDLGDVDAARQRLREALAIHRECGDRRFEAFALAFLAAVALDRERDLGEVRHLLDEATAIDAHIGDVDSGVLLAGLECALAAAAGEIVDARSVVARARADVGLARMLDIFALTIRVAEARRAGAEGRKTDELAHLQAVREQLHSHDRPRLVEERVARRVVESLLERASGGRGPIVVPSDGAWFEANGVRVSLGRRRSLSLMLARLAHERRTTPERVVSIDALFEAGWPGEKSAAAAARRRVYVGIDTLRSLGLRDAIVQRDRGYALGPAVEIREA